MTTQEALKQYFGYDSFRGGQERLVNDILRGKDVLGIMPTGAGKSICFQIPALLMDGVSIVISPLISLMKDQVNTLTQSGVQAAFVNSSIPDNEIYNILQNTAQGYYKLLYIAPERLTAPSFLTFAKSVKIPMLAVDEAHCISQWGQDFRPSYSEIPCFIRELPTRPVIAAFTATATPKVREDIAVSLKLSDPTIQITGFNRENLFFEVKKPKNKLNELINFISERKEQSGIVYCSTRKAVEEVTDNLSSLKFSVNRYHAGLGEVERRNNQDDFLFDRVKIMVATNAFGMGIDKSNVSFVVHYNMPKDIESYYQEAGRAGRDGESADCLLLYSGQDVRTAKWLIENSDKTELLESLDKKTYENLKEQSRKRLRDMVFYCSTYDCLRGYILKYFGETPSNHCNNCMNCIANFENTDITIEAQKILSCVGRTRQNYGVKMIIDVLRGSRNEKILKLGFDKLSTYGICKKPEKQLYEIINFLLINRYLEKTEDEFPVLKFGDLADDILRKGIKVEMNLIKEKSLAEKEKPRERENLRAVDKDLFEILRTLRKSIADGQRVPAFTIFTDSSIIDMCMKTPTTSEEFMKISGVGRIKCERYGEKFIKTISEFLKTHEITSPSQEKKLDISEIEISDEAVTVSKIADRINSIIMQSGYKKIMGKKINDWLVSKGYLIIIPKDGKNYKKTTETGAELGILSEERLIQEDTVWINVFNRKAQEFIKDNILEIL